MMELILLGFLLTSASAGGVTDLVLSCSLLEEASGPGGRGGGGVGGGAFFTRIPSTLVLRDIPAGAEESPEVVSPFVPPPVPDPELLLFEANGSAPQIPGVHLLLHADCNQQEVMCEISRYSPPQLPHPSDSAYFLVSLSVEGAELGTTLILQTLEVESAPPPLVQKHLQLPLSQSGTLLTEVVFLVFSDRTSVSAPPRGHALLRCGFRQRDAPRTAHLSVEWRLQHQGRGQKVLEARPGPGGVEVIPERRGSSVDVGGLTLEGDASLTLSGLRVSDQGSYICTISLGIYQAQQVVQLHLLQAPAVSLKEVQSSSPPTFICSCSHYFPLDVQIEWFSLSPADSQPEALGDRGSLSSHRQHSDGTFSLSSRLSLAPSPALPPGTRLSCRVTHRALDTPLYTSLTLETPATDSYWWILSFLFITVLFFYQVIR